MLSILFHHVPPKTCRHPGNVCSFWFGWLGSWPGPDVWSSGASCIQILDYSGRVSQKGCTLHHIREFQQRRGFARFIWKQFYLVWISNLPIVSHFNVSVTVVRRAISQPFHAGDWQKFNAKRQNIKLQVHIYETLRFDTMRCIIVWLYTVVLWDTVLCWSVTLLTVRWCSVALCSSFL